MQQRVSKQGKFTAPHKHPAPALSMRQTQAIWSQSLAVFSLVTRRFNQNSAWKINSIIPEHPKCLFCSSSEVNSDTGPLILAKADGELSPGALSKTFIIHKACIEWVFGKYKGKELLDIFAMSRDRCVIRKKDGAMLGCWLCSNKYASRGGGTG